MLCGQVDAYRRAQPLVDLDDGRLDAGADVVDVEAGAATGSQDPARVIAALRAPVRILGRERIR